MIRKFFYGPPNWLVVKFSAEDRRMFGFWTVIFAVTGSLILVALGASDGAWFLWLTALSVVALIPNFTAETPVEHEDAVVVESVDTQA